MTVLDKIKGIDIYLLDQILKERLTINSSILDAGCGLCRNLIPIHNFGFNIEGIDSNTDHIKTVKQHDSNLNIKTSSIEDFSSNKTYDFIICNAVLHFAESHIHFDKMFNALLNLMGNAGILFIRMTSNMATKYNYEINEKGIAYLPDQSYRYLLTQDKLSSLLSKYRLHLIEPLKTVNVDNLRCMTTLVISKNTI